MILEAGIHTGVHIDAYIRDPAPEPSLSTGVAESLLNECPQAAWFKHPKLNPAWEQHQKKSEIQDIGTAAHDILLEGLDRVAVIDEKDLRTNRAKDARDQARIDGKIPLLAHKFVDVKAMVETAQAKLDTLKKLTGKMKLVPERTLIFKQHDVWCRSRPDLLEDSPEPSLVVEYKTTGGSVHPDAFAKHIVSMGYHLQAGLIRAGLFALTGVTPEVVFLAQQTSPPYLCSLIGLEPMFSDMADAAVRIAVQRFGDCLKSGVWSDYPNQICWVNAPPWELARMENEEEIAL